MVGGASDVEFCSNWGDDDDDDDDDDDEPRPPSSDAVRVGSMTLSLLLFGSETIELLLRLLFIVVIISSDAAGIDRLLLSLPPRLDKAATEDDAPACILVARGATVAISDDKASNSFDAIQHAHATSPKATPPVMDRRKPIHILQ
jgi:hypothetical protein